MLFACNTLSSIILFCGVFWIYGRVSWRPFAFQDILTRSVCSMLLIFLIWVRNVRPKILSWLWIRLNLLYFVSFFLLDTKQEERGLVLLSNLYKFSGGKLFPLWMIQRNRLIFLPCTSITTLLNRNKLVLAR